MDIGLGTASLLFTAQDMLLRAGLASTCARITSAALEIAEHRGALLGNKRAEPATEIQREISMADVLEHVPYPNDFLSISPWSSEQRRRSAYLHAQYGRMLWTVLSHADLNPYWGELELFTILAGESLYRLLKECGFEPRATASANDTICMEVIAKKSV